MTDQQGKRPAGLEGGLQGGARCPTRQERVAELLAELLDRTAGELSRQTPRVPSTAPPPEVVDTVDLLTKLARRLPGFCGPAILGEASGDDWVLMANLLRSAADATSAVARSRMVIDVEDG